MDMKQTGFSLIELIIVVTILGVLSSIVYPSYSNYVLRSNRVDAKVGLSSLVHLQERFYTENLSYTDDLNDLIPGVATTDGTSVVYVDDANGYSTSATDMDYKITLTQDSANTNNFSLTALAVSSRQLKDTECRSFTVDQTGVQTALDSDGAANNSCWDK